MLALDKWNHSDFICKKYILNRLDNAQYDIYSLIKSAIVFLKVLDKTFKVEGSSMKKFIINKFIKSKMVDSKIVINHVQEFQLTLYDIYAKDIATSKFF